MTHTKTITREDGSRVRGLTILMVEDTFRRITLVHEYRNGGWAKNDKAATPAEIHATKLELWEKLKPKENE